jgi:hypothetical protein
MRSGVGSPAGRRGLLAGVVGFLLFTVAAGAIAIVHFASLGSAAAGTPGGVGPAGSTGVAGAGTLGRDTAALPGSAGLATSRSGPSSTSPRAGRAAPARLAPAGATAAAPAFFGTLPPGARLPSGAQCARWVRARPTRENKGMNQAFNAATGQRVGSGFFPAGDTPQANRLLAPRISGDFTGTTSEILRWAACKWGISQSIVFAQAAVESWWNQTTLGDWGTDASACPPGHGLGVNGRPGECPQSYGILQNRYPFERASWPGIADSTAMNADTAYAIWRSCYDGYETWLNNVPHGRTYRAGDAWGCVGRWFAGRWRTAPAQQYIARVRRYLLERIWAQPDFQQP